MKKRTILFLVPLVLTAFLLWFFRYDISLSRGIFSAALVQHYLPEEVELIDISGKDYLEIPRLPRIWHGNDDYLTTVSYGNTVLAVREDLITTKNDREFYDGRIDVYSFDSESRSFEMKEQILPNFVKPYYRDEKGGFKTDSVDYRSLGNPVRFYKNYILVDLGSHKSPRPIPEVDGMSDKKVVLKKLKEINYVFDEVVLYQKDEDQWSLSQVINSDLGDDPSIIKITDEGVGLYTYPWFGSSLALSDNYLIAVDRQNRNTVNVYKKDEAGVFQKHAESYNAGNISFNNFEISPTHYIRTVNFRHDPRVQIIKNETSYVEDTLTSPLHPDNVSFGETMCWTEDNLAIIGEPVYGSGSFSRPETESFEGGYPGFVHIFRRNEVGKWEVLQTLTSPLGVHYEQFGIQIASRGKYLLIASEPFYYKKRRLQPGFAYIYEQQGDQRYKLIKVIFGNPGKNDRYTFKLGDEFINFLDKGIVYEGKGGICYIPDVLPD